MFILLVPVYWDGVIMTKVSSSPASRALGGSHIARFRLDRHHLGERSAQPDAVTISRDVCGLQAQIMSAAFLQAWARNHHISRRSIEDALWKKRTLVKTSLMRQTLHLIPSDEFAIYVAALRNSRIAAALRVMARCGIDQEEGEALTPLIMEVLESGPCGQPAIRAAVQHKVSKRVRAWMDKVWSILRVPIAEGLICYGPGEGNAATFIRSDQWMSARSSPVSEEGARAWLMRSYLRAYGPATIQDFAHWSGMPLAEVRPLLSMLAAELEEVRVEDRACLVLREDLALLRSQREAENSVRLLPHFDPYLLAHRAKDHLVDPRHYKQVYRNQGWISPVVLGKGAIAGVWGHKLAGTKLTVSVDLFDKPAKSITTMMECEAEELAGFLGATLSACRIAKV